MPSTILLNKELKTLYPCLFDGFDFRSRPYQVYHDKTNPIKMPRKMIAFITRVCNYLHHSKIHKRPSIS